MSDAPFGVGDLVAGRFHIEGVLGTGGMGTVFAAEDRELSRRVAIKVMLPSSAGDPTTAERFLREARSAVQLQSIHATRVYDFGRSSRGDPFIVMEYLEGEDLETHVRRCGPVPIGLAVLYVLQACDALAEGHRLGLIHRDVKPRNLFLTKTPDGRPLVKVLDFGIAKRIGADAASRDDPLTTASSILGSPEYMSPEQMSGGEVDARSDVWSIGVSLYELLTRHVPFEAPNVAQLCAAVIKDPAPRLAKWIPAAPHDIERIVAQCIEKEPARRFQNAGELAAELSRVAAECVASERSPTVSLLSLPSIPRPANEKERLAALQRYRLLDTPPEEDFTFLTELAAILCAAPCAFVTLVDESRVWYKAWYGVEATAIEAPRDDDYCSWALLEQELLHIPDLTKDPRGANLSTTVGEPYLRMYCGANLVTSDGLPLGTLCVVDTVARALPSDRQRLLVRLARQVMALIELRAKKEELAAAIREVKRLAGSVL